jgi:hypothetical protein
VAENSLPTVRHDFAPFVERKASVAAFVTSFENRPSTVGNPSASESDANEMRRRHFADHFDSRMPAAS